MKRIIFLIILTLIILSNNSAKATSYDEPTEELSLLAWNSFIDTYDPILTSNKWKDSTYIWSGEWPAYISAFIVARDKGYITNDITLQNISLILDRMEAVNRWKGL